MTENIAKDTNKHSKAGIALVAVILGGPFVYLGLILIVLYRPEVMTWLGLEPFVAYLIELQLAGYENLVRLNSSAFADYFFNFHAASLLAMGIINSLFIILIVASLSSFPKIDMVFLRSTNSPYLSGLSARHFEIKIWILTAFVIWNGWFLISAPAQMEIKTKFPPNNSGIGLSILLWVIFSFFFQIVTAIISSTFLHYYWPNLRSWLVNKRKPNQKIKHRAIQHHRED